MSTFKEILQYTRSMHFQIAKEASRASTACNHADIRCIPVEGLKGSFMKSRLKLKWPSSHSSSSSSSYGET